MTPGPSGFLSVFSVPGMDCPTEAGLVQMRLAEMEAVACVEFDLQKRQVQVEHRGPVAPVQAALTALGFGAELVNAAPMEVPTARPQIDTSAQRASLWAVLAINLAMFVIELLAGWLADSTGLLADSLDMLADALVYLVGLRAVGRSIARQHRAARLAGILQMALGLGVLAEVVRRALYGSSPVSLGMIATACLALVANLWCAKILHVHRSGGAHMRASWIFTATDAVANLGVILAGGLVLATASALPDLIVGTLISLIVLGGAFRILGLSRPGSDN